GVVGETEEADHAGLVELAGVFHVSPPRGRPAAAPRRCRPTLPPAGPCSPPGGRARPGPAAAAPPTGSTSVPCRSRSASPAAPHRPAGGRRASRASGPAPSVAGSRPAPPAATGAALWPPAWNRDRQAWEQNRLRAPPRGAATTGLPHWGHVISSPFGVRVREMVAAGWVSGGGGFGLGGGPGGGRSGKRSPFPPAGCRVRA